MIWSLYAVLSSIELESFPSCGLACVSFDTLFSIIPQDERSSDTERDKRQGRNCGQNDISDVRLGWRYCRRFT